MWRLNFETRGVNEITIMLNFNRDIIVKSQRIIALDKIIKIRV